MPDLAPFVDVEACLGALLGDLATVGSSTPADFTGMLPFLQIQARGGPQVDITRLSTVVIDAFGVNRPEAKALAETVEARLGRGPHRTSAGLIDSVKTLVSPAEAYWSQTVRRFVATFQVATRRQGS